MSRFFYVILGIACALTRTQQNPEEQRALVDPADKASHDKQDAQWLRSLWLTAWTTSNQQHIDLFKAISLCNIAGLTISGALSQADSIEMQTSALLVAGLAFLAGIYFSMIPMSKLAHTSAKLADDCRALINCATPRNEMPNLPQATPSRSLLIISGPALASFGVGVLSLTKALGLLG